MPGGGICKIGKIVGYLDVGTEITRRVPLAATITASNDFGRFFGRYVGKAAFVRSARYVRRDIERSKREVTSEHTAQLALGMIQVPPSEYGIICSSERGVSVAPQ